MAVDIQKILSFGLPNSEVILNTTDNVHYEATVICDAFIDKRPIERQKIIYALIGEHITSGAIHALSLKTFTLQEWKKKCDN